MEDFRLQCSFKKFQQGWVCKPKSPIREIPSLTEIELLKYAFYISSLARSNCWEAWKLCGDEFLSGPLGVFIQLCNPSERFKRCIFMSATYLHHLHWNIVLQQYKGFVFCVTEKSFLKLYWSTDTAMFNSIGLNITKVNCIYNGQHWWKNNMGYTMRGEKSNNKQFIPELKRTEVGDLYVNVSLNNVNK